MKITRETTESKMEVTIENGPVRPDYRQRLNTPIPFLNHMIEHIVWRSGLNITVKTQLRDFTLSHLICEDLGITVGKAFAEYIKENTKSGLYGFGDGYGIIDEARAFCAVSFESRAYFDFTYQFLPDSTEGMLSEDLSTFLEGLAQGANMTLQIDLQKGRNGHHIWEAVYRSVGLALGRAAAPNQSRKGMTAGVAGAVKFTVEKD